MLVKLRISQAIPAIFSIVFLVLEVPFVNAQQTVDIPKLIREVSEDRKSKEKSGYTYNLEFILLKKNLLGNSKLVKRYEAVLPFKLPQKRFYKHPMLLVYDSSKSLSPSDIVNSRKELIKDLELIENSSDNNKKSNNKDKLESYVTLSANFGTGDNSTVKIDILQLLEKSSFSNPKLLKFYGRDFISLEFKSRENETFENPLFYLKWIEGFILIDKKDKTIAEVQGYTFGKLNEYRDLPFEERENFLVFHYLQTRVTDGVWFPKKVALNFMNDPKIFNNIKMKIVFNFSEYRRSTVDVRSPNLNSKNNDD